MRPARFFTTGSATGSGDWRVLRRRRSRHPAGGTVIVAVPTTEVTSSLNRLVLIEVAAAGGLLALVALGSWLILRRGLRPLERMATSARSITAGDLSQRVSRPTTAPRSASSASRSTRCSARSRPRSRNVTQPSTRLRQFLADASHELRTPLTSIQGFAELFRLGVDQERVELAVILRRIEEESARMKTLVEDLLLLARLDETRPVEREPVDLAVLAADACSDASRSHPERPIVLDAPEPVVVAGDHDHLRQAIANLVNNALRHTPDGSQIEVGAHLDDGVRGRLRARPRSGTRRRRAGTRLRPVLAGRHARGSVWASAWGCRSSPASPPSTAGPRRVANPDDGGALFTLELPIDAPA